MHHFQTSIFFTAALFCSISVCGFTVSAEDAIRVDCDTVTLNDEWQDYHLDKNEFAYCPFVLPSNGRLNISIQTSFDSSHYVYLLDKDYATVNYASIYGKGAASPETINYSYDMTEGEYYVRVESWNDCQGLFRIKGNFTSSSAPNPDGGDSLKTAVPYQLTDITGFLSSGHNGEFWAEGLPEQSQNLADYYKYEAEKGTYDMKLTTIDPDAAIVCDIYDSSYQQVDHTIYDPTATLELEKGTYYFCVRSEGDLCGDYHLQIDNVDGSDKAYTETDL